MTYEEKLVNSIPKWHIDWVKSCVVEHKYGIYLQIGDVEELINQAMQAQREACVLALQKNAKKIDEDWELSEFTKQAILNAEVQP